MSITTPLSGKSRFDARLSAQEKELFEKAAQLGGFRSLTEFVLGSARKRAQEIIAQHELIVASKRDGNIFFQALLNPETPNAKLKTAAEKFNKKKGWIVELQTVPLSKHHLRDNFSCGQAVLDDYIKRQANQDIRKKLAMCFVLADQSQAHRVKCYYTLSNASLSRDLIPVELEKRFPKAYKTIPTTLLGRLARDVSYAKQGLGEILLIDALYRSYLASMELGSFAVVVDPIDMFAEQFYACYGFTMLPDSGKMFIAMKTIEQLFK